MSAAFDTAIKSLTTSVIVLHEAGIACTLITTRRLASIVTKGKGEVIIITSHDDGTVAIINPDDTLVRSTDEADEIDGVIEAWTAEAAIAASEDQA